MNQQRVNLAREKLREHEIQGLLVAHRDNVRWLTGFSGSSGLALLTLTDVHMFTDGRYTIQTGEEAVGAIVHISDDTPIKQVGEYLKTDSLARVGFEANVLTVDEYRQLVQACGSDPTVALVGIINGLRAIKDESEISAIRVACRISDAAFDLVLPHIKPGVSELHVVRELVYALGMAGADNEAFDSIVASGPRSALPHAKPSERVLSVGEPLLLDFGAMKSGYVGDITRTLYLGNASAEFMKIYNIVREAQLRAIDAIRPGITGKGVDSVARDVIFRAGFGDNFSHGLGHQIGLHVHDGPALSQKSPITLQEGMVVTVEPGIYIEGWGGVRIEDDVLVTALGAEILTSSNKQLIEL